MDTDTDTNSLYSDTECDDVLDFLLSESEEEETAILSHAQPVKGDPLGIYMTSIYKLINDALPGVRIHKNAIIELIKWATQFIVSVDRFATNLINHSSHVTVNQNTLKLATACLCTGTRLKLNKNDFALNIILHADASIPNVVKLHQVKKVTKLRMNKDILLYYTKIVEGFIVTIVRSILRRKKHLILTLNNLQKKLNSSALSEILKCNIGI